MNLGESGRHDIPYPGQVAARVESRETSLRKRNLVYGWSGRMGGMLLLLLLLLLTGMSRCDDEEVLLALKQGIRSGQGALDSWVAGSGICNWTGIQCDGVHKNRVQAISLPNKNVQGVLTPLLGRLQYLQVLNFDQNNLTGPIPATLSNCSRLANISLGSNQLTGIIPRDLDRCRGLQRLDLWNNQLEGPIPASIGSCPRMDYLSLGQNNLNESIPPELGKLGNLQILRLFTNNFVGDFPSFLTNCTKLRIVSFRNNSLTGFIPPYIDRLDRLEQLRIQSNFFAGVLPSQIGNMTSLYYIDISSNRLSGRIPSSFGKLVNLQELYLNNNSLSGPIPDELAGCRSLGTMDLSHNLLQGPLSDKIGDFQSLTNLTLDNNLISGTIPDSLGKLYKLINLDLSNNMLQGSLPPSLSGLQNIQLALNLGHNSLSGSIPAWIGTFRAVQNISLEYNKLSGGIPSTLTQCSGLHQLNLAGNQLVGPIPQDIGNLASLVVLDLSSNLLSGEIPASLASISTLKLLNLSMNQLAGPVPNGKAFTAAALQGNPGVCGAVVGAECKKKDEKSAGRTKRIVLSVVIAAVAFLVILLSILGWWCLCFRRRRRSSSIVVSKRDFSTSSDIVGPLIAFTAEELASMTEEYAQSNLLGGGAFSTVYMGTFSKQELVAVKLLKMDVEMTEEVRKSFFAEVQTLGQIRHRNLLRLIGYCWTWETKALVLEYMPNGSLQQLLRHGSSDWQARLSIALGVAQGLAYLHHEFDAPIIHCDLKPANILLDADFEAHVADFGISRIAVLDDQVTISTFRGSIGYAPPEYATSTTVSTKGDVYSFGVVLLEMVTGKPPTSESLRESGGEAWSLQDWVKLALPVSFEQVLDPKLHEDVAGYELQMREMLKLALQCTSGQPHLRPTMQHILSLLTHLKNGDTLKQLPSVEELVNSPSPYSQHYSPAPIWR